MGSLSAGVGTGFGGTGASVLPGPPLGRPIAQKGTSSSFCWAAAGGGPSTPSAARDIASDSTSRVIEGAVIALLLEPAGPAVDNGVGRSTAPHSSATADGAQ